MTQYKSINLDVVSVAEAKELIQHAGKSKQMSF